MNFLKYTILSVLIILISTTFSGCESADSGMAQPPDSPSGQGGSLARFTISNGHLYTVDDTNLKVFDITNEANPIFINNLQVGFGIETIFPRENTLFLGTRFGMTIYDISNPAEPSYLSDFSHIYSCDPVVVEGNYAFVTLRSGSACRGGNNELQVIDISSLSSPRLVKIYPMLNPKGLGIDNGTLFVCDNGLKVYNATNVNDLQLVKTFDIAANDVIPYNGKLLVIGDDGFYQYAYNGTDITLLSKLEISAIE